jgi:hypothetical protein
VYSVSTGESKSVPRIAKTEIFAVEPQTGKTRLVFSDADAAFLLLPAYPGSGEQQVMAAAGQRVFARGFERRIYTGGWATFPAAIYELSTDGSNRARKLFDIEGENGSSNFRNLFVSPSGAKIGYLNHLGGKWHLFLRETSTGKLLQKTDLGSITLDCFVRGVGFMPDGARLFFTLETGDVDATSKASYARVGSYVMDDGSRPVRVAREVAMHPKRPGYRIESDFAPVLLGALADGRYLFSEFQWKLGPKGLPPGGGPVTFLYAVDPVTNVRKDFPTTAQGVLGSLRFSSSGQAVAFSESQRQQETESVRTETQTVWAIDLDSGQDRQLFSFATKPMVLPWMSLIGWLNEK